MVPNAIAAADPSGRPAWWAMLLGGLVFAFVLLVGIEDDRKRWTTRVALLSWRLAGLRNVVARLGALGTVTLMLLAVQQDAEGTPLDVIAVIALPTVLVGVVLLQAAVLLTRRSERRLDEALLRDRGLPVRKQLLSTATVALLCLGLGPLAITAMSPVLSLPLNSIRDESGRLAAAFLAASLLFAAWLFGSAWLIFRQWRRRRRSDRVYWPAYRAALRSQGSSDDGPSAL